MLEDEDFHEMSPEEKLHAENEILKLKLQAEYGMKNMNSSLGDEVENEWLNYIHNFEKQYAEEKRTNVYDFIGNPAFCKAEDLNPEELSKELSRLNEIMEANGLELGIICTYPEDVIYRFITEELFAEEMDDIRIPGMRHCFTYEEYHPNHDYDIRKHGDEFIKFLIVKKWNEFFNNTLLASSISYNNNEYDQPGFAAIIQEFQEHNKKMKLLQWKIRSTWFDLPTESGGCEGFIKYKTTASRKVYEGEVRLEFKRSFDYWSISNTVIPGFNR